MLGLRGAETAEVIVCAQQLVVFQIQGAGQHVLSWLRIATASHLVFEATCNIGKRCTYISIPAVPCCTCFGYMHTLPVHRTASCSSQTFAPDIILRLGSSLQQYTYGSHLDRSEELIGCVLKSYTLYQP